MDIEKKEIFSVKYKRLSVFRGDKSSDVGWVRVKVKV